MKNDANGRLNLSYTEPQSRQKFEFKWDEKSCPRFATKLPSPSREFRPKLSYHSENHHFVHQILKLILRDRSQNAYSPTMECYDWIKDAGLTSQLNGPARSMT